MGGHEQAITRIEPTFRGGWQFQEPPPSARGRSGQDPPPSQEPPPSSRGGSGQKPPSGEVPPGSSGGGSGQEPPHEPPPSSGGGSANGPRRLFRSRSDRLIAGVGGGLGQYFRIDPVIFRIGLVALVFVGGIGLLLYFLGWLFVPPEGSEAPKSAAAYRRQVLRRVGLVAGVIALCFAIAFLGAWAAAAGGGVVVAGLIVAAGVALIVGAFTGGRRWLILPALSLALPVGLVAAADIDLDGGYGEREHRPASAAQVRDSYQLGAGRLVVDLRSAHLPPGDRQMRIDLGVGEAVVLVPEDVCVATRAEVGMGLAEVFDRDSGGADVDWRDSPGAPNGTPRLVLDAEVGLGHLQVGHREIANSDDHGFGGGDRFDNDEEQAGNRACATRSATRGEGGAPVR